jgi:cell division transport system permease protein
VARLDAVVRFGQLLVALLAAILAAGLVAVVVNTIRLQVLARRDEVEVALLIGATPAFVARPFLWFGIVEGLLGAGVALALVEGALALLAAPAAELFALYGGGFRLRTLDLELALLVVGAGGLLGWCAGWLSTRAIRLT